MLSVTTSDEGVMVSWRHQAGRASPRELGLACGTSADSPILVQMILNTQDTTRSLLLFSFRYNTKTLVLGPVD